MEPNRMIANEKRLSDYGEHHSRSVASSPTNTKVDFDSLPKWILIKMRDQMKQRQALEKELEEKQKQFQEMKEDLYKWYKATNEKYQPEIERCKIQNQEYARQMTAWRAEKEREFSAAISQKNLYLAKISSAADEIKLWKNSQNDQLQDILKLKDKEIEKKDKELKIAREKLHTLEHFGKRFYSGDYPNITPSSSTSSYSSYHSAASNNNYSQLSKLHYKLSQKKLAEDTQNKTDQIQLSIAELMIKKQKLEVVINEAGKAVVKIPEIEKELFQKRKDMNDLLKDMKSAKIKRNQEKQKLELMEDTLSIISDSTKRQQFLKNMKKIYVISPITRDENTTSSTELFSLQGPEDEGSYNGRKDLLFGKFGTLYLFGEYFAAKSISLYPIDQISLTRSGDPIADYFKVVSYPHCTIFVLGDGAGWGFAARDASFKAANTFIGYCKELANQISTTIHASRLLLRALRCSHESIVAGLSMQNIYEAGTTTLLGGIVLQVDNSRPSEIDINGSHICVFASIGDCKIFHFSHKKQSLSDITLGLRANINDLRDPGGRLGPMIGDTGEPDLRNLFINSFFCSEGDLILVVSDGVYDNLDPYLIGKSPRDISPHYPADWNSIELEVQQSIRSDYSLQVITKIIKDSNYVVPILVDRILLFASTITQIARNHMEANQLNPNASDPTLNLPGKMDHSTCFCYKIPIKRNY